MQKVIFRAQGNGSLSRPFILEVDHQFDKNSPFMVEIEANYEGFERVTNYFAFSNNSEVMLLSYLKLVDNHYIEHETEHALARTFIATDKNHVVDGPFVVSIYNGITYLSKMQLHDGFKVVNSEFIKIPEVASLQEWADKINKGIGIYIIGDLTGGIVYYTRGEVRNFLSGPVIVEVIAIDEHSEPSKSYQYIRVRDTRGNEAIGYFDVAGLSDFVETVSDPLVAAVDYILPIVKREIIDGGVIAPYAEESGKTTHDDLDRKISDTYHVKKEDLIIEAPVPDTASPRLRLRTPGKSSGIIEGDIYNIDRDSFAPASVSGYEVLAWGADNISGEAHIYSPNLVDIQLRTSSQPFPRNTVATADPIIRLEVQMGSTGSLRAAAFRISSNQICDHANGVGNLTDSQTFSELDQVLQWDIDIDSDIRYFQYVPGGNTNIKSITVVTGTKNIEIRPEEYNIHTTLEGVLRIEKTDLNQPPFVIKNDGTVEIEKLESPRFDTKVDKPAGSPNNYFSESNEYLPLQRFARVRYQSTSGWAKVAEVTLPANADERKSAIFFINCENNTSTTSESWFGILEWNIHETPASNSIKWLVTYGFGENNFNIRYHADTNTLSFFVLPSVGNMNLWLASESTNGYVTSDIVLFDATEGTPRTGLSVAAKADYLTHAGHVRNTRKVAGFALSGDISAEALINALKASGPSDTDKLTTVGIVADMFAELVNGAPAALDTLQELAQALGDDPNFATTITNLIGTKADKTYVDDIAASLNDITATPLTEITWQELKDKRDAGLLTPGQQYRITDYITTTAQTDTQSAGHQFDIIVTADDVDKLNENARACLHEGDTYFANSKLEAWQLKYCLDNDTNRFAWADEVNGKGVIYRMIDEFNNDVPYDFKNIQFKRYRITASAKVPDLIGQFGITGSSAYTVDNDESYFMYTFNMLDLYDGYNYDVSVFQDKYMSDEGYCYKTQNNIIRSYKEPIYNEISETNEYKYSLNDIVFTTDTDLAYISEDGTYGEFYAYSGNTLGNDCHYNTFGNNCNFNTFGNNCYYNTFGNNCYFNTFGNDCYYNTFGNNCYYNTFGNDCYYNTFGNNCYSNTFGNYCNFNTFGNYCNFNTFGNYCPSNTFGDDCNSNTFGNNCYSNTFGNNCYYNTFGNYCPSNTFGDDCNSNTFGNNCYYNKITGDSVRYISVDSGLSGASFANQLELYDSEIVNKAYQISFKQSASGRYLMLWATDTGTMTGKVKDSNLDTTWEDIV